MVSMGSSPRLGFNAVGDEFEIFIKGFRRPGDFHEFHKPVGRVIGEPWHVHDGDDAVVIGRKGFVF